MKFIHQGVECRAEGNTVWLGSEYFPFPTDVRAVVSRQGALDVTTADGQYVIDGVISVPSSLVCNFLYEQNR